LDSAFKDAVNGRDETCGRIDLGGLPDNNRQLYLLPFSTGYRIAFATYCLKRLEALP
jgi:hypothetical protein